MWLDPFTDRPLERRVERIANLAHADHADATRQFLWHIGFRDDGEPETLFRRSRQALGAELDGANLDGQADLAYETADGWVVVDFKTDVMMATDDGYRRQVALYAEAISRATGLPARGVLLRV